MTFNIKDSSFKFLFLFLILLGVWYFLYEVWIKPLEFYDHFVIENIAEQAVMLLNTIGFTAFTEDIYSVGVLNFVALQGSQGVYIGAGCDGLIVQALFVLFVVLFPGSWKAKLWYIPMGVLFLHIMNVIRVSCLAIIMSRSPEWLEFNHDYTFTILIYGIVFFLWYIWVNRFSPLFKEHQNT